MTISNRTLVQIAAWGGFIVSSTGFYLSNRLVDRYRNYDYYKQALKTLRTHAGAVFYLGEPIKDRRFKITDPENNHSDEEKAQFAIPVSGPKDRGTYHIWAVKDKENWKLTKAELELKSKPDARIENIFVVEMFAATARERFFYHNTLLSLVKALEGKNITVDLLNDSYVCGNLVLADGFMNLSFKDAIFCDPRGNEFSFEELFIQSRNIRYVHVPEDMSILNTIRGELTKNKKEPPKKPKEQSRKVKKALKQHLAVVASLDI